MLDRQGYARLARRDRRPRPRGRRRRLRADPDPRRRPGGAARRRDVRRSPAAASARRRRAPAGSRRRCARCPVVLEIAERVRELVERRVDRRLHEPGRHRHARAARPRPPAIGLCNVAIGFQRRWARWLGVEPSRVVVDQVGLNHLTWVRRVLLDGGDVLPALLAEHGDEIAAELELPRRLLDELGVVPVLLPPLLLRARRGAARAARRRAARAGRRRDRARAAASCTATRTWSRSRRCSSSAAARSTARRRSGSSRRLVSGDGAVHEVDVRNAGTLAGLADDDVVEVPARVTRVGRRAARAAAARAGAARPDAARRRVRAAGAAAPRSAASRST